MRFYFTEHEATFPMILYEICEDSDVELPEIVIKDFKMYKSFNRLPSFLIYHFACLSGLDPISLKKKCISSSVYKKKRLYLPASHSLVNLCDRKLLQIGLRLGLNANALDRSGKTALYRARMQEKKDFVELLASYCGV